MTTLEPHRVLVTFGGAYISYNVLAAFERAFVFFFLQSAKGARENFANSFKSFFKLRPCRQNNTLLFHRVGVQAATAARALRV